MRLSRDCCGKLRSQHWILFVFGGRDIVWRRWTIAMHLLFPASLLSFPPSLPFCLAFVSCSQHLTFFFWPWLPRATDILVSLAANATVRSLSSKLTIQELGAVPSSENMILL